MYLIYVTCIKYTIVYFTSMSFYLVFLLYLFFIKMSLPKCEIDHSAINNTVQKAVANAVEFTMGKVHTTGHDNSVKVTMERPMWTTENFRDVYDEIPLRSSDQFIDKGSHYELRQHFPMVTANEILLHEQNHHIYVTVKKNKGNIRYSVHKEIPLPPYAQRRGITSYFNKGMLIVSVPK